MEPAQSERRRYHRYPVVLDVDVRDGEQASFPARIRDLCLGGALIGSVDAQWLHAVQPGKILELRISLPATSGSSLLSVSARVVRLLGDSLGVSFENLPPSLQEQLQRFVHERLELAAHSDAVGKTAGSSGKRARAILQQLTEQRRDEILNTWLQAVEESLWDSADHAQNDIQRSEQTGNAVSFSRLLRHGALQMLGMSLQCGDDFTPGPTTVMSGSQSDDLALVDTERFETWLESSSLVAHLEDSLEHPLDVVRSQLRQAFGDDRVMELQPIRLACAFESWIDGQGMAGEVKRVGLNEGRRTLPRLLGSYYRDLGRALEEAGFPPVETEIVRSPVKAKPDGQPARERREDKAATDVVSDSGATAGRGHAAASAQSPAEAALPASAPAGRGGRAGEAAAVLTPERAGELLVGLPQETLGAVVADGAGRSLKAQVVEALSEIAPEVAAQPLAPALDERIDATERVLKHMLTGTGGTSRLREWLDQLSLRMLAAAIANPDFFRHPGHPLMQLLGQLEHLSTFLPNEGLAGDSQLAETMEQLVNQALSVDVRSLSDYAPILDQMGMLATHYGERLRQDAVRAIERLEGQERRRKAHLYVQAELGSRLGGCRLHRVVAELIDSAWATLLELRCLREGEEGAQLHNAWGVLERLQALLQEDRSSDAREAQDISGLEAEILTGLSYVGYDSFQAKAMAGRIREAVRRRLAGLLEADEYVTFQPVVDQAPLASALDDLEPEVRAGLSQQIEALHLGTTLRVKDENGERVLRLVWHSPDKEEFAFLDTSDGQVRPFSRDALASGLHEGSLRVNQWFDSGITERALDGTLREMQEHLHFHERRDALTGLFTQQQFLSRLAAMLGSAVPSEHHALAFLELDHFDAISSNCGYKAAEQLLQLVSKLLQERLGDEAFLAFFGGRRFGFMLRSDDPASAKALCESVRHDVYSLPFRWEGRAYPVTGSVGMVSVQVGERNPEVLLSSLELACAAAKEAGGNRLVVFSEDDDAIRRSKERLHWLSATEDVIKSKRIRMKVQTIAPVRPQDGLRGHHEVLLRVYDEQGAELDLERFIATAEAFNLMGEVDRLVIQKILAWGREHPDTLMELGGMAINLSGVSLSDPGLLSYIRTQLDDSGVSPEYISFEVTETAAVASLERARAIIEGIKAIGCHVALDDFGSGLSSYSYLKAIPVDYVKIDGSFIKDLLSNSHDQAIVKAINEIAHFMGIRTIAEYVVTEDIIDKLDEIGVDYMQGYAVQAPRFLEDSLPQH